MLFRLLRRPQRTIKDLLLEENPIWGPAFFGYFCLAATEGSERLLLRFPTLSKASLIALLLLLTAAIGTWTWAGIYGGLLHLSAKLLGGEKGAPNTIRAVGLGLFWPGSLALLASILGIAFGFQANEASLASTGPTILQLLAAFWALYATVAALRARHSFPWWKAILAYLLPIFLILLIALVSVIAIPPASTP